MRLVYSYIEDYIKHKGILLKDNFFFSGYYDSNIKSPLPKRGAATNLALTRYIFFFILYIYLQN